jgi:hypothetical protein
MEYDYTHNKKRFTLHLLVEMDETEGPILSVSNSEPVDGSLQIFYLLFESIYQ